LSNLHTIIEYASGHLSDAEFELELNLNPELWDEIQRLVPDDISSPECPFRSDYENMQAFETNGYLVRPTLLTFGYNALFAHSLVSKLVHYRFPSVKCREPIRELPEETLEKLRLSFIGGDEVDGLIRTLLVENMSAKSSAKKQILKETFHIQSRKHPDWVQEPEWPMGKNSPLKYERQERNGEMIKYYFSDVDTGEIRVIEQFY